MEPTKQQAETIEWEETVQRSNSIKPIHYKEDWHSLLEILQRSKQALQPLGKTETIQAPHK